MFWLWALIISQLIGSRRPAVPPTTCQFCLSMVFRLSGLIMAPKLRRPTKGCRALSTQRMAKIGAKIDGTRSKVFLVANQWSLFLTENLSGVNRIV